MMCTGPRNLACGAAGHVTQNLDIVRLRNGSQNLNLVSRRFAGISVSVSDWLDSYTTCDWTIGGHLLLQQITQYILRNATNKFVGLYFSGLSVAWLSLLVISIQNVGNRRRKLGRAFKIVKEEFEIDSLLPDQENSLQEFLVG